MARNTAEIEATPRKATPTPEYRALVEAQLDQMQAVADSSSEALVLKAAFLSDTDEDIRNRSDAADRRERMLADGWKAVNLWLNPTEIAALGAGSGSKKLAGGIRNLIAGRAVHSPSYRNAAPQEEGISEAGKRPDVVAKDRGKLIELWKLADDTLDGEVISGPIRGARLSALPFGFLSQLWHEACVLKDSRGGVQDRHDQALLEAFLDWRFEDWRDASTPEAQQAAVDAEPYEILGIKPGASFLEAKAAYRRAAAASHPDNAWLFRQVQQAWETIKAAQPEAPEAAEKQAA
jgi:hypothetical protein